MVQWVLWWERQRPMGEKYCLKELLMIFLEEGTLKTRKDNRMVKLQIIFKISLLGDILKK